MRFRFLDSTLNPGYFWERIDDMSVRMENFQNLSIPGLEKVFVLENEINYLTFPKVERSIVIWGSGFKATGLRRVEWLRDVRICYFWDLDSHGFQILSLMRKSFPKTESFCMDWETLEQFGEFIGSGEILSPEEAKRVGEHLTDEERPVFEKLNTEAHRLEQENITQEFIIQRIHS